MFRNRNEAGGQLAERLKKRSFHRPLVLAIPRGGVVIGAAIAKGLGAELDVVLSRKIPAPGQPELAIGAISEDGQVYLNDYAQSWLENLDDYLVSECRHQMGEIARRRKLVRQIRAPASIPGRSVIITDDGIATGSTMIAALQTVRSQKPKELIVAVPVASPERLKEIRTRCDEVLCLLAPEDFHAVGEFYDDFTQVEDEEALQWLKEALTPS